MDTEALSLEHHLSMHAVVVVSKRRGDHMQCCICCSVRSRTHTVHSDEWLNKDARIGQGISCDVVCFRDLFLL
jgi:hypothetical protein